MAMESVSKFTPISQYVLKIYKNPKMGRTDRLSQFVMFYSLDVEQKS
jgi:hypothetical protein